MQINDWNDWMQSAAGEYLLGWEQKKVDQLVADVFGFHAVQLGLAPLKGLQFNRMPNKWLGLEREAMPSVDFVTDFRALPFSEQSLDLVVLPHTLEMHANPHFTLREVERVLVPEGRVIIFGINPFSLWGFRQWRDRWYKRLGAQSSFMPSESELIGLGRLKDWLSLLSFEVEQGGFGLYKPALQSHQWLSKFNWLELAGNRWWPIFGAGYYLVAVKRVRGMRLMGTGWKSSNLKPLSAPAGVSSMMGKPTQQREGTWPIEHSSSCQER
jgi:SAM-dependent methyltransferase